MALPDGKPIVDEDEADAADGLQPLDLNAVASVQPDDDIEVSIEEDAPAAPVAADQAEAPDESETPACLRDRIHRSVRRHPIDARRESP